MRTSVPVHLSKYKHLDTAKEVKQQKCNKLQVKFFDRESNKDDISCLLPVRKTPLAKEDTWTLPKTEPRVLEGESLNLDYE